MSRKDETPIIGESPAFMSVLEQVSEVAPLSRPVLVVGERGTGKELIAERLHFLSGRWQAPLVKLNCAAISEALLESELFGHETGAFTDASRKRLGRFEHAEGGSLFLDELSSTSMSVQEKILRVIEYGEFERLGSSRTRKVDVRLIGATNQDLPELAKKRQFRSDLLDRLAFDVITLPPLRARREDILSLAEHFALRMTRELDRDLFAGFSRDASRKLLGHSWPGNVRELKNVVERAVYRNTNPKEPAREIDFDPFDSPWRPVSGSPAPSTGLPDPADGPLDWHKTISEMETGVLKKALEHCEFNQRKTAEHLGLTYHQLRGLLRKYEMTGDG